MPTILAVDDSATMRKALEITFAETEFEIVTCDSGPAALEKVKTDQPALVIADVSLPPSDGYELCTTIKLASPALPVLMLSSRHNPFDPAKGAQADGHIDKPFDTQVLADKVRELVASAGEAKPAAAAAAAPARPAARPPAAAAAPARPQAQAARPGARPSAPGPRDKAPPPGLKETMPMGRGQPEPSPPRAAASRPTPAREPRPPAVAKPAGAPTPADKGRSRPSAPGFTGGPAQPAAAKPAHPPSGTLPGVAVGPGQRPAQEPTPVAKGPAGKRATVDSWPAPAAAGAPAPEPAMPAQVSVGPDIVAAAAGDLESKLGTLGLTADQVQGVLALSLEVLEQVVWEVVPTLAETLIKEEIARLTKE